MFLLLYFVDYFFLFSFLWLLLLPSSFDIALLNALIAY